VQRDSGADAVAFHTSATPGRPFAAATRDQDKPQPVNEENELPVVAGVSLERNATSSSGEFVVIRCEVRTLPGAVWSRETTSAAVGGVADAEPVNRVDPAVPASTTAATAPAALKRRR
jgi:hypothetical protein